MFSLVKPPDFSWRYQVQFPLLAQLPPLLAYRYAAQVGQFWQARHMGGVAFIRQQMQEVYPEADAVQINKWIADYCAMVEQEALDTWYLHNPEHLMSWVSFDHLEPVERAHHQGRRILMTSGHLGRFWLVGAALRTQGFSIGTLTRDGHKDNRHGLHPAEHRFRLWKLGRLKASLGGPFLVEGQSLRPLYTALDQHWVNLLFDTPYAQNRSGCVTVPFLNGTIKVPTGIYKIAKKTKALIAPCYVRDRGDGGVIAEFSELLDPIDYNEEECMRLLADQLSVRIQYSPGHWWLWAALPLLR